jgi:hypothetical protein
VTPAKRRRARLPDSPTMRLWPDCGRLLGLGRTATFDAHHRGEIPWPVWRIGNRLVCPKALVLQALGLDDEPEDHDGGGPTASRHRRRVKEPSTTRRAARKAGGADGSA